MTITREVTAVLAGAIVAAAACKGEGSGASGDQASGAPTTVAIKSGDRIPAGGVQPAPGALSKARPAKVDPAASIGLAWAPGRLGDDRSH